MILLYYYNGVPIDGRNGRELRDNCLCVYLLEIGDKKEYAKMKLLTI